MLGLVEYCYHRGYVAGALGWWVPAALGRTGSVLVAGFILTTGTYTYARVTCVVAAVVV